MNVLTGDETGLIKVIDLRDKRIAQTFGAQAKGNGIECMCWATNFFFDSEDSEFAAATTNGDITTYAVVEGKKCMSLGSVSAAPRGIGLISERRLVTCTNAGAVHTVDLLTEPSDDPITPTLQFYVGSDVSRMRVHQDSTTGSSSGIIAVGGKEHDLQLWSVETRQSVFEAKNVRPDKLRLRVPIWITDFDFMGSTPEPRQIVTATGHHQVRIYDIKAQKRPVADFTVGEHPIMSLAVLPDSKSVIIGDSVGTISNIDLRTGRLLAGYRGDIAGSVRSIQVHPCVTMVASAGLDRFLRIHHTAKRSLLHKVYLKQKLSCVLLSRQVPLPSPTLPEPIERYGLGFWHPEHSAFYEEKVEQFKTVMAGPGGRGQEDEDGEAGDDVDGEDPYEVIFGKERRKRKGGEGAESSGEASGSGPESESAPAGEAEEAAGAESESESESSSGDSEDGSEGGLNGDGKESESEGDRARTGPRFKGHPRDIAGARAAAAPLNKKRQGQGQGQGQGPGAGCHSASFSLGKGKSAGGNARPGAASKKIRTSKF